MRAMLLKQIQTLAPDSAPLAMEDCPAPLPLAGQAQLKVQYCGVCHTELDEIEGRTAPEHLPRILGHQVVGVVAKIGEDVDPDLLGQRVGLAWIFSSCGECGFCQRGDDNLCPDFQATGRDADGGYAEYVCAPAAYLAPIPSEISSLHAAPMLCAGAIGYRSLRLTELADGEPIGMTGFGASAHLMMKMIGGMFPNSPVYVFARHAQERAFALELGAKWAGTTDEQPDVLLAAIVDTTPAWLPVTSAMKCLRPGGRLVINAIRKEPHDQHVLQEMRYETHLWMEKEIKSVANVSRRDVREFLGLAAGLAIEPEVQEYTLEQANQALLDLKFAPTRGAKVLRIT